VAVCAIREVSMQDAVHRGPSIFEKMIMNNYRSHFYRLNIFAIGDLSGALRIER